MTLCRCWMACRRGMGVLCDTVGTHHRANMWLNVDCCGLFCGIVTQGFIVFGMYSTSFAVIFPWMGISVFSILLCCLHSFLCVMAMISHIQTMTTNPGAVPREACPLSDDEEERDYEAGKNKLPFKKYCRKCQSFKPSRAHHCSMCGRCIVKMDHHCPWVNNCVGIGNHKHFILFVFWIFLSCLLSVILGVSKFSSCYFTGSDAACGNGINGLLTVILLAESFLFGMFTLCMLADQHTSVVSHTTKIDRLKGKISSPYDLNKAEKVEINEICGGSGDVLFDWKWLYPTSVLFDEMILDHVMGYRLKRRESSKLTNPLTVNSDSDSSIDMTPVLASKSSSSLDIEQRDSLVAAQSSGIIVEYEGDELTPLTSDTSMNEKDSDMVPALFSRKKNGPSQ